LLRSLKILLAATLLAALAGAGYAAWYVSTPVAIGTLAVEFEIPQGMPFRGAAQRLEEAGVAVGAWRFELLAVPWGAPTTSRRGATSWARRRPRSSCSTSLRAAT